MLDADDLRAAAQSLRHLLAAVEAGEVEASVAQRDHLAGAAGVLEHLVDRWAVRQPEVRLGRPQVLGEDVVRRVVDEQRAGRCLRAIAAGLSADGVPTARGGAASASSVQSVLRSQAAAALG